jgi:hypothetical protein
MSSVQAAVLYIVGSVNVNRQTYSSSSTVVQRKLEVSTLGVTICACTLRPDRQRCHDLDVVLCCLLPLATLYYRL